MKKLFKDIHCYGKITLLLLVVCMMVVTPAMAQEKGGAQSQKFKVKNIDAGVMPAIQNGLGQKQLDENQKKIQKLWDREDGIMSLFNEVAEIQNKMKAFKSEFNDIMNKTTPNLHKLNAGDENTKQRVGLTIMKSVKYEEFAAKRYVSQVNVLNTFLTKHSAFINSGTIDKNSKNGAMLNRFIFLDKKMREQRDALKDAYTDYESVLKEFKEIVTSAGLL